MFNPLLLEALKSRREAGGNITGSASHDTSPRATFLVPVSKAVAPHAPVASDPGTYSSVFFTRQAYRYKDINFAPGVTRTYSFPTRYADTVSSTALFLADATAASARVPAGSGLRPVSAGPGRAIVAVTSYHYARAFGLAPYNEIAVSVIVEPDEGLAVPFLALSGGRASHAVVLAMPVTSKENERRGRLIWGLPKEVRPIAIRETGEGFVTTASNADGSFAFELVVPATGAEKTLESTTILHSVLDGRMVKSESRTLGDFVEKSEWSSLIRSTDPESGV